MMEREDWEDLIGKTLAGASHTAIGVTLTFRDGTVAEFETSAGCCSRSWIESFECPDDVDGSVLTAVDEDDEPRRSFDLEPKDESGEWIHNHHVQVYQTIFRTDRGRIYVEYRNASNGYYGGSLDRVRS